MKRSEIAAQLYTLREHLKTPADIVKGMKKVREIGFEAVQVSGLGPIDQAELKKIIDGEGLVCCATHEGGNMIIDETDAVIAKLNALGCKYTAYPHPHAGQASEEDYLKLAADLNVAGKKMAAAGQVLTYHNHALEFTRFGKRTALELLYDETDADALQGEIDTYWVQAGGGDPADWCRKLKNRLPLLHLKEYGIIDNKPTMLEIGNGNLNWPEIITAAREAGTEWFIIEQDSCRMDEFESLRISLEYLLQLDA